MKLTELLKIDSKTFNLFVLSILGAGALLIQACAKKPRAEETCHFVQNSFNQRVSWAANLPVKLYIDESVPTEAIPEIESAAETWNTSFGKKLFQVVGVANAGDLPQRDGSNVIYWVKPQALRADEQARTTIWWADDALFEADMMINSGFEYAYSQPPGGKQVDFQSLVAHELGHALGLAHIEPVDPTVMEAKLMTGILRRQPQKVDLESLACEY